MNYKNRRIATTATKLEHALKSLEDKRAVLRAPELKALYAELATLPNDQKAAFGKELNTLKTHLQTLVDEAVLAEAPVVPLDVTAPFAANSSPEEQILVLPESVGSAHPLMTELDSILDIFYRMGFSAVESRQIDDDYHMFGSLNFPEGHPARDDYDTFMTTDGFIAPAHTSTMQNRVLRDNSGALEAGSPIAVVVPGRVFRNEDVDARHEHTFYQLEGVYVGENVTVAHLIATLKEFMAAYYQRPIDIKIQPFYFPFTEPSFEFAVSCPFCNTKGCGVCGEGWIELLGCGMIHPNVLREAGIDPVKYSGFAWGVGFMRMAMIKYNIEDIRHFESAKLDFLRQFS